MHHGSCDYGDIITEIAFNSQGLEAPLDRKKLLRYKLARLELSQWQIQKRCDNFRQLLGVVLMNHVACIADGHEPVILDGIVALPFIGPAHLPAFFPVDDQHGTRDSAEKFQCLRGVERLRRGRAVQWIEFPNPFALLVLFHAGAR